MTVISFNYNRSKIYKNGGGAEGDEFYFLNIKRKPMLLVFQMRWRDKILKTDDNLSIKKFRKIGLDELLTKITLIIFMERYILLVSNLLLVDYIFLKNLRIYCFFRSPS